MSSLAKQTMARSSMSDGATRGDPCATAESFRSSGLACGFVGQDSCFCFQIQACLRGYRGILQATKFVQMPSQVADDGRLRQDGSDASLLWVDLLGGGGGEKGKLYRVSEGCPGKLLVDKDVDGLLQRNRIGYDSPRVSA